jgi:hypothetical protein
MQNVGRTEPRLEKPALFENIRRVRLRSQDAEASTLPTRAPSVWRRIKMRLVSGIGIPVGPYQFVFSIRRRKP